MGRIRPFRGEGAKVWNRRYLDLHHGIREGRQSLPAAVIPLAGGPSVMGQSRRFARIAARPFKASDQTLWIPSSSSLRVPGTKVDRAPAVPTWYSDCPNQRRGE
jgi:hypothetical protein